jgi:hypothetical protein
MLYMGFGLLFFFLQRIAVGAGVVIAVVLFSALFMPRRSLLVASERRTAHLR